MKFENIRAVVQAAVDNAWGDVVVKDGRLVQLTKDECAARKARAEQAQAAMEELAVIEEAVRTAQTARTLRERDEAQEDGGGDPWYEMPGAEGLRQEFETLYIPVNESPVHWVLAKGVDYVTTAADFMRALQFTPEDNVLTGFYKHDEEGVQQKVFEADEHFSVRNSGVFRFEIRRKKL